MSRVLEYVVATLVIALVVVMLWPATRRGREPARRTQCKNNLKAIGLALHNYHDKYNSFPPAYTVDKDGNPLHSWRTLLLPYLDRQALYDKIDLSKPWNDPVNAEAYKTAAGCYVCPSATVEKATSATYLALVAPDSVMRPVQSRSFKDVTDGIATTLIVIEVSSDQAVHWMSPEDASEEVLRELVSTRKPTHSYGGHIAFVDGSVRLLDKNVTYDQVRALVTVNGKEIVKDF
ncbi:DUF1559 domain-containing protein [Schlesneria sp. DSM 10557]|uniref:DUF1559 domain-containing protein n=1 Tax=Schlesneria sp. DSM 10557 TaxID=3044399 RepID=UPI0035A11AE8